MPLARKVIGMSPVTVQSFQGDTNNAVVAAGTTQGTATTVQTGYAMVTSGTGGVILTANGVGDSQVVYNSSGSSITVYPPSGAKLNSLATNAGMILANNTLAEFYQVSATQVLVNMSA